MCDSLWSPTNQKMTEPRKLCYIEDQSHTDCAYSTVNENPMFKSSANVQLSDFGEESTTLC